MEITKILRIFYTAWIVVFAVVFLTRCKSNPNHTHGNITIDNNMTISPASSSEQTDSALTQPTIEPPVNTSVALNNLDTKPVKLIYLK